VEIEGAWARHPRKAIGGTTGVDATQRRPLGMEENRERFAEDDPRHHTTRIRDMLSELRDHLREDIAKINEPRAEALFETTAETLDGLISAFEDYERGQEEAWRGGA
jgi:hypothetical protein